MTFAPLLFAASVVVCRSLDMDAWRQVVVVPTLTLTTLPEMAAAETSYLDYRALSLTSDGIRVLSPQHRPKNTTDRTLRSRGVLA